MSGVGGAAIDRAALPSAKWVDDSLVIVSNVEAIGLSFNDKMTVSPDGKTLTSVVHVSSPQGDIDVTIVFDREK